MVAEVEMKTKKKQCDICSDSIMTLIAKKIKEFEEKEKQLDSKEDELERKNRELVEIFTRFESDKERLALGEKQFVEKWRELEIYAVEIEEDRYTVKEQLRELESKDVQFKERLEEIESRSKDIEAQRNELEQVRLKVEADGKKMEERIHYIDRKEKQMEGRIKWLDLRCKHLERQQKEIESEKMIVEADRKRSDERTHKLDQKGRELDEKVKNFESSKRRLDADWKKLDYRIVEVDRRERGLDRGHSDLRKEQKELELTQRKLEDDRKKLEEGSCELSTKKSNEALERKLRKLESDQRELMVDRQKHGDQCRELEIKIKKLEENKQELESSKIELDVRLEQVKLKENLIDVMSKEIELKQNKYGELCTEIVMDGKNLQIFLNQCWGNHEKMVDGVLFLLGLSENPAKLVLDALEGFFPPHLTKNGNGEEFTEQAVQRSCISLLEELLKISYDVMLKPELKDEASRLSSVWFTKLKPDSNHSIQILGFLLVLANYDVASNFNVDELFNYVKIVAHLKQVPELCCLLNMTEKIPGLIQDLIERKQHLVAIRYAFNFNLVEKFPLDSLLKGHIETSKMESAAITESGNSSSAEQSQARTRMISDFKAAIACIEKYKISSEYSVASLRQSIASLFMHDDVEPKEAVVYFPAAATTPADSVYVSAIESKTASNEVWNNPLPKRRKLLDEKSVSTKNEDLKPQQCDNGSLEDFLRQNLNFCLMEAKAKEFLRSSVDPTITVFCAIRLCVVSTCGGFNGEVSAKWCISLLKEIRGNAISPSMCERARKLSVSWRQNLKDEKSCDPMKIACHLLFHDVYQLRFGMTASQVVPLNNSLDCPKQLHYAFEQIGLPEFLPDLIKRWIETNERIQAVRYIHALQLTDRFPLVPLIRDHLSYWNKHADELYKKGPHPSDHFMLKDINYRLQGVNEVLAVVRDCKLESEYSIGRLEQTRTELIRRQSNLNRKMQQQNDRRKEASSSKTQQFSSVSNSKRNRKLRKQKRKRALAEQFSNSTAPPPLPLPPPPLSGVFGFHPPPPPPPPYPFNDHQQQGFGSYADISTPFQNLGGLHNSCR